MNVNRLSNLKIIGINLLPPVSCENFQKYDEKSLNNVWHTKLHSSTLFRTRNLKLIVIAFIKDT